MPTPSTPTLRIATQVAPGPYTRGPRWSFYRRAASAAHCTAVVACCLLAGCTDGSNSPADSPDAADAGDRGVDAVVDAVVDDVQDVDVQDVDEPDGAPDPADSPGDTVDEDGGPAVCGDGVMEGVELCDEGDQNGGRVCAWDCTPAAPFNAYDDVITGLMQRHGVPGGAVAVTVRGRLVLVRGFGDMDPDGTPMNPLARFRIASISKPITSAAVMLLVERGQLDLDAKVFELLAHLLPAEDSPARDNVDPRLFGITVRHLLWHAGGWDRDSGVNGLPYDPMFIPGRVSAHLGVPSPPTPADIARYMTEQPLEFNPGERYAYSNFGYSLLGRVIETVTGRDYEEFVQEEVLRPIGARGMAVGATREDRVQPDEPYYFPFPGQRTARSVFDEDGNPNVTTPYGSWSQQSLDSHGGWISSTVDLLRFSNAVDGFDSRPDLLQPETLAQLTARPESLFPEAESPSYYYAMGWSVRVIDGGRQNRWHTGALPGTATIAVRTADDVHWVALYNHWPPTESWWGEMDAAMWQAAATVDAWPEYDLFDRTP